MDKTDKNHKQSENVNSGTAKHAARRLANPSGTMDSKELGDLGELAFILSASSKGLAVSKPFGDCRRYDLIVDSGRRLLRIQVKSLFRSVVRGDYQVRCRSRCKLNNGCYSPDDIDFMALYLARRDIWYLIPIQALGTLTVVHLHPDGLLINRTGCAKFEIYKEAWHQLDERVRTGRVTATRNE